MSEVINDPKQIRLGGQAEAGRPDFENIFAGFQSAVDFPVSAFWQDALAASPGAKVILSDRDPDDWYASFSHTILPLILDKASWPDERRAWFKMLVKVIIGKALGGRTDWDGILAAYRANPAAALALQDRGQSLVFRAGDGWEPLCEFLNVAVPNEPYPRTNARADFFAAARGCADLPAS